MYWYSPDAPWEHGRVSHKLMLLVTRARSGRRSSDSFQGESVGEGLTCVWQLVQPGAPRSEQVVRTLLVCYKGIDQAMPCCKVWLDGATARTVTGSRGSTLLQCMLVRRLQPSLLLHLSEPGLLSAIGQAGACPIFAMFDAEHSISCLQALGPQGL